MPYVCNFSLIYVNLIQQKIRMKFNTLDRYAEQFNILHCFILFW